MTLRQKDPLLRLMIAVFLAATAWAFSLSARAAGPLESASKPVEVKAAEYQVANGDTLGGIALKHGVSLEELLETNEIDNPDRLFAGQKLRLPGRSKHGKVVKRGVVIRVPKGFSLSRIAAAYETSLKSIVRANKLANPDRLREGQKLLIPGVTKIVELVPPPPCFKDKVTLYRVRNDETRTVSLCFCDGRPNPAAIQVVSELSGPIGVEMPFPLHRRLVVLLQRIAERFPDQRIEIISGQRTSKHPGHESYHNKGQALDFRVAGVSNRKLVSFVRKFKNVGAGYYPNSVFIHMDTRDRNAYWIDYSRPGEKSIYGRAGMTRAEIKAIRDKRRAEAEATAPALASSTSAQPATPTATETEDTES